MRKLKVFYGDVCAITIFIIDIKTIEFLLKLERFYHMEKLLNCCDMFLVLLISSEDDMTPFEKKLFLAVEYELSESKVRLQ
jgi:hypothetical protein